MSCCFLFYVLCVGVQIMAFWSFSETWFRLNCKKDCASAFAWCHSQFIHSSQYRVPALTTRNNSSTTPYCTNQLTSTMKFQNYLSLLALSLQPLHVSARRRLPSEVLSLSSDQIQRSVVQDQFTKQIEEAPLPDADVVADIMKRDLESQTANLPKSSDHLVTSMPYLSADTFKTNHYAGHIAASRNDDKKLFYWLFAPDTTSQPSGATIDPNDIPLLIWLNGGPGCSSMDGLWLENGPFRLVSPDISGKSDWTIDINPYSWHMAPAYVLYIDQPVGTGLSFTKSGKYCKSDLEIDIDFYLFLENFLLVHSDLFLNDKQMVKSKDGKDVEQYGMKRQLYFSGESHAGHYIPSMMDFILKKNDDLNSNTMPLVKMDLKGAAIGNGWVDPFYQYAAAELAYGRGMVDLAQKEALDKKEMDCKNDLQHGKLSSKTCFDLLDDVVKDSGGVNSHSKVSVYDNRLWERKGVERDFPKGHKNVEKYLGGWTGKGYPSDMKVNYKDVLKAIHADESIAAKQRFEECTDPPYMALAGQDGLGVRDEVVRILNHGDKPRLLFFNGINDMICNHVGNERFLDKLPWAHQEDWTLARRFAWDPISDSGSPAGYMKEFENLLFLKVLNSGHMVPMDVPDVALEMMRTFMYIQSFASGAQRIPSAVPGSTQICTCPTCEDPSQHIQTVDELIDEVIPPPDEGTEGTSRSVTAGIMQSDKVHGGWIGGIFGATLTLGLVWLRDRRRIRASQNHRYDDNDLTALRETEMT